MNREDSRRCLRKSLAMVEEAKQWRAQSGTLQASLKATRFEMDKLREMMLDAPQGKFDTLAPAYLAAVAKAADLRKRMGDAMRSALALEVKAQSWSNAARGGYPKCACEGTPHCAVCMPAGPVLQAVA